MNSDRFTAARLTDATSDIEDVAAAVSREAARYEPPTWDYYRLSSVSDRLSAMAGEMEWLADVYRAKAEARNG